MPSPRSLASLALLAASPVLAQNLVVNGDFEAGNTGFLHQYVYRASDLAPYYYGVTDWANRWSPQCYPVRDHTTHTGKFQIIHGYSDNTTYFWRQAVPVNHDARYRFRYYAASCSNGYTAIVTTINGGDRTYMQTPAYTHAWAVFNDTWNSGNATTADIRMFAEKHDPNDLLGVFGVDDVSLTECLRIVDQPRDQVVIAGHDATFSITVTGEGPFAYRWTRVGSNTALSTAPTLVIHNAMPANEHEYKCTVTGACGNLVSKTAALTTTCRLDCDGDRFLDFFDLDLFTECFGGGEGGGCGPICNPDFNEDGFVDFFDFDDFVHEFELGC